MGLSFWCVYRVLCIADGLHVKNLAPFPYLSSNDIDVEFHPWLLFAEGYYEALGIIRDHINSLGFNAETLTISKEMVVSFSTNGDLPPTVNPYVYLTAAAAHFSHSP